MATEVSSTGKYADRQLRAGVEIEVPFVPESAPKMASIGDPGENLDATPLHVPGNGEATREWIAGGSFDKIYGIEVRTSDGGIPLRDLSGWYADAYEAIQDCYGREIEPTGLFGDSTAGLHTHLSPIPETTAKELWNLSNEPWMQIFVGTSLASFDTCGEKGEWFHVNRSHKSQHVNLERFGDRHNHVVNKHRSGGEGHYEWRLPEPMPPEHFTLLVDFIARFISDPGDATSWARSLVMEGDERLTAFKRAERIGPDLKKEAEHQSEATDLLIDILHDNHE